MDLPTTGEPTPITPLGQSSVGNPVNVAFSWNYWTGLQIAMHRKLAQPLMM